MACGSRGAHPARVVKRFAAVILWFVSVGAAFEYATLLTGLPSVVGLVVAGLVSAFVGIDPLHLIWRGPSASTETSADRVPTHLPVHSRA